MLEKTANSETVIYKEDGKLFMRLPGGVIKPYDHRFPDCPSISEGDHFVKPTEDNKDD